MLDQPSAPALAPTRFKVKGPDGTLAAYAWGQPSQPTVVLVHGYPDSASKWQAVAQHLADRYHVVAYDVRGAGESFAPSGRAGYRLDRLLADFTAVLDAVSPNKPVHLVAHDWGSIQSWEFATEPALAGRLRSFTSVSGPCLDHVGHWMRDRLRRPTPTALGQLLKQLLKSWYIYFFQLPWLPEALWRGVLGQRWHVVLRLLERTQASPRPTQTRDGANGVGLYRANIVPRLLAPRQRVAQTPVQILVPVHDKYVSPALSTQLTRWVPQLWRREVQAGHWLTLKYPALFAALVAEFTTFIDGEGPETPALQTARVHALAASAADSAGSEAGHPGRHAAVDSVR